MDKGELKEEKIMSLLFPHQDSEGEREGITHWSAPEEDLALLWTLGLT